MAKKRAKCPVCNWDINGRGKKVRVGEKVLTVCCEECAAKVSERGSRADKAKDGARSK